MTVGGLNFNHLPFFLQIVVHTCICMYILVETRDISPGQVFLPTRPFLPTRQVFCLLINFSPNGFRSHDRNVEDH